MPLHAWAAQLSHRGVLSVVVNIGDISTMAWIAIALVAAGDRTELDVDAATTAPVRRPLPRHGRDRCSEAVAPLL